MALFILIFLVLPFVVVLLAVVAEDVARRRREWRERLAGPDSALRQLVLGCSRFDASFEHGRLRDDPEVAALLAAVRRYEYASVVAKFATRTELEGFLAAAELRMGRNDRPLSAGHGYLHQVLSELARRQVASGAYR